MKLSTTVFIILFSLAPLCLYGQAMSIDSNLVIAEQLLNDSADHVGSIRLCSIILNSDREPSSNEKARAYRIIAYAHTELGHYHLADSFFQLGSSHLGDIQTANTADFFDLFHKRIYFELIQGHREEADDLIKIAYNEATHRQDTLNKYFVHLLLQKAVLLNNSFKISASRRMVARADTLSQQLVPADSLLIVAIGTVKIAVERLRQDPLEAEAELIRLLDICKRHPITFRSRMHRVLVMLANLQLLQLIDVNKSLKSLDQMHELVQRHYPPTHPLMARTLSEYADTYSAVGDVDQTRRYAEQANFILMKLPNRSQLKYSNITYIAHSHLKTRQYKKAKKYYEEAYNLSLSDAHVDDFFKLDALLHLSTCYLALNNQDSAKIVLDHAHRVYKDAHTSHSYSQANLHFFQADYLLETAEYRQAKMHLKKALNFVKSSYPDEHEQIGKTYRRIARAYFLNQELDSAFTNVNKSLEIFKLNETIQSDQINQTNYSDLIPGLELMGSIYFEKYLKDGNKTNLDKAAEAYDYSILFIQRLRRYVNSQSTRLTLSELYYDTYAGAIKTATLRYRLNPSTELLNKLFELIQSSKAQSLLENIHKSKFKHYANVPKELLDEENRLQNKINLLERLIKENPYLKEKWETKLFTASLDFKDFLGQLKHDYPSYFQLKYDHSTVSIPEVRKRLSNEEGLLEYFVGDEHLYLVIIDKTGASLYDKSLPNNTDALVQTMRSGISNYYLSPSKSTQLFDKTKSMYTESASELYNYLFDFDINLPEELIIVPDGILGYIPFEALLIQKPDLSESYQYYPYLINDYKIAYHYSSTLWSQATKKSSRNNKLLALAPAFDVEDGHAIAEVRQGNLLPLINNIDEVLFINKLFKGEVLTGQEATKERFTELAPSFGILHFATHAIIDDELINESYLALSVEDSASTNDHLYIGDLYNSDLPAELVVLSACETGLGELKKGEGILSLARGFSFAGASSVVTSLWSVSDKATANLMQLFYTNLKRGQDKDDALRQAKLDFMKEQNEAFAAPFYWASTIAIGDMKPIQSGPNWSIILFVGAALLIGFLLWKRRN